MGWGSRDKLAAIPIVRVTLHSILSGIIPIYAFFHVVTTDGVPFTLKIVPV